MAGMKIGDVKLTDQQYKFCVEYLVDFNQAGAAKRAGYNTPLKRGSELMQKPHIKKAIALLQKEDTKQTKMSKEKLLAEISDCAGRNAKMLFTKDGLLVLNHTLLKKKGSNIVKKEGTTIHDLPDEITRSIDGIKQKVHCFSGETFEKIEVQTELKLVGKASAWDMLMKHYGAYAPDKVLNLNLEGQLAPGFWGPGEDSELTNPLQDIMEEE